MNTLTYIHRRITRRYRQLPGGFWFIAGQSPLTADILRRVHRYFHSYSEQLCRPEIHRAQILWVKTPKRYGTRLTLVGDSNIRYSINGTGEIKQAVVINDDFLGALQRIDAELYASRWIMHTGG